MLAKDVRTVTKAAPREEKEKLAEAEKEEDNKSDRYTYQHVAHRVEEQHSLSGWQEHLCHETTHDYSLHKRLINSQKKNERCLSSTLLVNVEFDW